MRQPLTTRYPWLYPIRVRQRQIVRHLDWAFGSKDYAREQSPERLACKVYRHQSKLRRGLSTDPQDHLWQDNKVHNHALALSHLDGIILHPGQHFSFWRLVGSPSAARGYREGMELSMGRAQGGIGGGLCQIANLIHWLALHSPLRVTERANHSFDPFPDKGRVVPYGVGAALFYNYIDLGLFNPTDQRFQLRLWLTETLLNGEIRCDTRLPHRYRIIERNAGFLQEGPIWIRHNEIWRQTIAKEKGRAILDETFLYANRVRAMYEPQPPMSDIAAR